MNTHELAELLLARPDMPVVLAKDSEGNAFKEMSVFSTEKQYENEIIDPFELEGQEGLDGYVSDVVVFWPV